MTATLLDRPHEAVVRTATASMCWVPPLPAVQPPSNGDMQRVVWDRIVRSHVPQMLAASDLEAYWESIDEAWSCGLMAQSMALGVLAAQNATPDDAVHAEALAAFGAAYGGEVWGEACADAMRLLPWSQAILGDIVAEEALSPEESELVLDAAWWSARLVVAIVCLGALGEGLTPANDRAPDFVLRTLQLAPRRAFAAVRAVQLARQDQGEQDLPLAGEPDALTARLLGESDRLDATTPDQRRS